MRLWHESLIPKLPQKQLLGQWRECIALLGKGWGRKHRIVNYVFQYDESYLLAFTMKVYNEMIQRGYHPKITKIKEALKRRGLSNQRIQEIITSTTRFHHTKTIFQEHNEKYLKECIKNLKRKGIEITENHT